MTITEEWKKKMQALKDSASGGAPKRNYLLPGGYEKKNELLAGIGGPPLPNYSVGKPEEDKETATNKTDDALNSALEALLDRLGAAGGASGSETETALRDAANKQQAQGDALRDTASARGDALYDALLAFAEKQDGRYEALLSQIAQKGYRDFVGVEDILADYAAQGERAAGYAAANGAADNGGNPDSYAAAQAARKRLDFTEAGTETALAYYNEQLDRWLATLSAAGGDAEALYGLMQENVDGTHKAAEDSTSAAAGMFADLLGAESDRAALNADVFSSLLSHYTKVKENAGGETAAQDVSPMQVDVEYEQLINGKESNGTKYTPQNALIILWKKYPTMREYLMKKYEGILNPEYTFKD